MATPAGVIRFVGDDPADGSTPRSFTFESLAPDPLGYEALTAARPNRPVSVPLKWRGAKVVEFDIPDAEIDAPCTVTGHLESPFTTRAIGLVKGGWLPSIFASLDASTIILLDRNVVSEIIGRFDAGVLRGRDPDFIDLFAELPVRLNPMPFVLEGNVRALPTAEAVQVQLAEVVAKLSAALPQASLVVGSQSAAATLGLIEEARAWFDSHTALLLSVADVMPGPVSRARMEAVWREILASADRSGVSRRSIVLLAVLSALASPNGKGPARDLLKLRRGYAAADAYNALSDLRAIEILINLLALYPDQPVQFCTADRSLALFWVGMGIHNPRRTGAGTTVDFDLHPALLPDWAAAFWRDAQ